MYALMVASGLRGKNAAYGCCGLCVLVMNVGGDVVVCWTVKRDSTDSQIEQKFEFKC